jgi:DNA polymerase III delta subunit
MNYQNAVSSLRFKKETKFALVGNERYLKKSFIKIAEKVHSDCTLYSLYPDDQEEALGLLESEDLFGAKLFVFHSFNEMKMEAFERAVKEYGGNLILVIGEKARLKSRAITGVLSNVAVVECKKLRDYGMDYPLWIRNNITEAGYTAPDEIDQQIFLRVGPNMSALSHELEKLFIVKSEEKVITVEDVEKIVSKTAVSTAFEIFESLLKRNVCKALECFYSYSRNHVNFIEIVSFLGSYLEKMYRMLLLKEKRFASDDIADIINIPRFLVKTRYMPRAQAFGKNKIAAKIDSICNLNVHLRLFKGDKKILMERFILGFAQ